MNREFDHIVSVLKSNPKYVAEDGSLLKLAVYEDAMQMNEGLLHLLLADEKLKSMFFTSVDGALVFDKRQFTWLIQSREFLPDSYTAFTNKIGLTSGGEFLSNSGKVVLNFPYKDAVLVGGQDKEDQKREEIMFHEILAKDQITNLLAPKVFTKAVRYTGTGEKNLTGEIVPGTIKVEKEENIIFDEEDNLIIKGNNLIALSCLLERYEGQVKLIYIDPPYNTGSNSFGYNDRFNHSTWLLFMKNRLELARRLLSENGSIFISIDEKQEAYLKVLCDDIFGNENLLEIFHVQVRYTSKSLNEKDDFQPVMEYVLAYAKEKHKFHPNKPYKDYDLSKFKWKIVEKAPGNTIELGGKKTTIFKPGEYEIIEMEQPGVKGLKDTWASGSVLTGNTSGKFFDQYLSARKDIDGIGVLYKVSGIGEDGLGYRYFTGPKKETSIRGQFFSGIPLDKLEELKSGSAKKYYPIVNFNYYDYSGDFGNIRHEGGVPFNTGKKPEKMLKKIFELASEPGDLVMDFHLGSGSSSAVALKLHRKFIGIEQMDYIHDKAVHRLINVVEGDSTGISQSVNWHGGGSFVYFELLEDGMLRVREIENATEESISTLKKSIYNDERIVPYLTAAELQEVDADFEALSLEDKKQALIRLINKNKLYVNYSSIDDKEYAIADKDKAFTRSFYEGGKN